MKRNAEAGLAVLATLLLGAGFWLFTGADIGGEEPTDNPPVVELDAEAVARGMTLATEAGCTACHSADGSPLTGPTWKGVAGSSRPLESGETVVADVSYLTSSIIDPAAQIVQGFPEVMPTNYGSTLVGTEIDDLVAYIQSLAD